MTNYEKEEQIKGTNKPKKFETAEQVKSLNHYEKLGVSPTSTIEEIKAAHRAVSKIYHPDINKDPEAEEIFIEITKAYKTLEDKDLRYKYDDDLAKGRGDGTFSTIDKNNTYSNIFGKARKSNEPTKGKNRTSNVTITFEESITGVTKQLKVNTKTICETCKGKGEHVEEPEHVCPTCNGKRKIVTKNVNPFGGEAFTEKVCRDCRDQVAHTTKCEECDGLGKINNFVTVSVAIPKGVKTGNKIRVRNCGEPSEDGGEPGDLLLAVQVEENTLFTREGDNILYEQPVTFAQLVLGDTLEVPTPEGNTKVQIQPGTPPSHKVYKRGAGTPNVKTGLRGDLIITLTLQVPTAVTPEQEELLRTLNL